MESRIASKPKRASRTRRVSEKTSLQRQGSDEKTPGLVLAEVGQTASEREPAETALAFSHRDAVDCLGLATQVAGVIRSFHSQVASPLASIGLQLELLRMNPATGDEARAELARINQRLDVLIDVIRAANRSLRDVEKSIRHDIETTSR